MTRFALACCALSAPLLLAGCDSNDDVASGPFFGCQTGTMSIGQVRTGTVTADDCPDPERSDFPTDYYRLHLRDGQTLEVRLDGSQGLDPYLTLYAADGTRVARDDDGGSGTNALLSVSLDAGDYVVAASGYAGDTGAYSLVARP